MSNKTIKKPGHLKPVANQKRAGVPPAPPGPKNSLSPEEQQWVLNYQQMLPELMLRIGKTIKGSDVSVQEGGYIMDTLAADVEKYILTKYKGAISLRDMMVIFGCLAGKQAGASMLTGRPMPDKNFHEAAQLFGAAMRTTAQAIVREVQKARLAAKPMSPLIKH